MGATTSQSGLSGLALGKTKEEIMTGLNPTSGRKFLSHQIGGHWIGPGGTVRGVVQFTGAMYAIASGDKSIKDLISTDAFKNPFLTLYSSKAAPGTKLMQATGEALLSDADLLPFEEIGGIQDFVLSYLQWHAPFWGQGYMESGSIPMSAIEFGGPRVAFNPYDTQADIITSGRVPVYSNLTPWLKRYVRTLVNTGKSSFDNIEVERQLELKRAISRDNQGISEFTYHDWIILDSRYKGRREQNVEHQKLEFEPGNLKAKDPGERALAEHYAALDKIRGDDVSDHERNMIMSNLPREKGWTNDQYLHVLANTNIYPQPEKVLDFGLTGDRIKLSQTLREQMLLASNNPDLAVAIHRSFFMLEADEENLWDVTLVRSIPEILRIHRETLRIAPQYPSGSVMPAIPEKDPSLWNELVGVFQ